ncbi:MAG: hypothetical protein KDA80_13100 [Planctomycetaceae bacterium]|nr:hypothetical protein [Planctomycetaceae bacterium]
MAMDFFNDFDFGAPLSVEHLRNWREHAADTLDKELGELRQIIRDLEEQLWHHPEVSSGRPPESPSSISTSSPDPQPNGTQPNGEPSLSQLARALEERFGKPVRRPLAKAESSSAF